MRTLKITLIILLSALLFGTGGYFVVGAVKAKKANVAEDAQVQKVVATKGLMKQTVEVDDASVVSEEDLDLSFLFPGKIEKIFAEEGKMVSADEALVKLETKSLELNVKQLNATLVQAQASLNKLRAGATKEELAILEKKVDSTRDGLKDAQKGLIEAVRIAYTQSDDAVRGKTNQLFSGIEEGNPQLVFSPGNAALESDIETRRKEIDDMLDNWSNSVDNLKTSSDLERAVEKAEDNLKDVRKYLNKVAFAVNALTASESISQEMIDSWKIVVSAGRAGVDEASARISEVKGDLDDIKGGHAVVKEELAFQKTAARVEDMVVAQARVDEILSQIEILNEKIQEATITAPAAGIVMKNFFKEHENVAEGLPVVAFSNLQQKVQADIPEDEIRNVKEGNSVTVTLSALPGVVLSGKVFSIQPQMLLKDGDVYYRANIILNEFNPDVRLGMTADVSIDVGNETSVLNIPNKYIEMRGGSKFVVVMTNGKREEREVETGRIDNISTEIISGISEGQTIIMPGG